MDGSSQDFVTHFVEQSGWVTLLLLGAAAAVYLGLLAIVVVAVGRLRRGQGMRFLAVVAISLGALVVALTIYESAALYLRSDPPGSGLERQSGYDTFVFWAHASFIGLYVLVIGLAAWLGRRMLHTWRWAAVVAGVMVAFMVLTFPFVDFVTECNVGVPLVSWGRPRC